MDLASGIHAVGDIGPQAFDAALRESLQFGELALFGVQLAGSGNASVSGVTAVRSRLPRPWLGCRNAVAVAATKMNGRDSRLRLPRE